MSVAEPRLHAPAHDARTRLSGWGRTSPSWCALATPRDAGEVLELLERQARAGTSAIARGAGRSYGDAAQNEAGTVLDMTALADIVAIDAEAGMVTAQAGCTLARVMDELAPHRLTLPG